MCDHGALDWTAFFIDTVVWEPSNLRQYWCSVKDDANFQWFEVCGVPINLAVVTYDTCSGSLLFYKIFPLWSLGGV